VDALFFVVNLHRKLKEEGGRLILCGLDPDMEDLFRIIRLKQVFETRQDVAGALASMKE
jgi:anti-anti-sigma regulatory factor